MVIAGHLGRRHLERYTVAMYHWRVTATPLPIYDPWMLLSLPKYLESISIFKCSTTLKLPMYTVTVARVKVRLSGGTALNMLASLHIHHIQYDMDDISIHNTIDRSRKYIELGFYGRNIWLAICSYMSRTCFS